MKSIVVMLLFMCSAALSQGNEATQDEFDVKPGGQEAVYEKEWGKYKCTFKYKAQGGTNEKWQVMLEKWEGDDGKQLQCTVTRGATSYLFFETFSMSLTGPKVHLENYYGLSTGQQALKESEVKMDKKKRTVYAVDGQFEQKLESMTLAAKIVKKREDL